MRTTYSIFGLIILIISTACQGSSDNKSNSYVKEGNSDTDQKEIYLEGKDYTEFVRMKVMDQQGFTEPAEAMSILLPKDWKGQGEIIWIPQGKPCSGTYTYFKGQSADGQSTLSILPSFMWSWSQNPQVNHVAQLNAGKYCSVIEPMNAQEFVEKYWSQELDNGVISDIKVSEDGIATMGKDDSKNRAEMMENGSPNVDFNYSAVTARIDWSSGQSGILFCKVTIAQLYVTNPYNGTTDLIYVCNANRMIYTFPKNDQENAEQKMTVIMGGIHINPAWKEATDEFWKGVRYKGRSAHLGRLKMQDERTAAIANQAIKNGNQRLADIDNQTRSWEARQNSNDKIHQDFVKTIREVENYQDASGKVELSSGYNHAWSRGDGSSFIMSNNPNFDPSSVLQDQQWKQMKKVQ